MRHLKSFNESLLETSTDISDFIKVSFFNHPNNKALKLLYIMLKDPDSIIRLNNLHRETTASHDEVIGHEVRNNEVNMNRNTSIKIGRLVRKYAEDNKTTVPDSDIEKCVNLFKAYFSTSTDVKIVQGEDIKYYYNRLNYIIGSEDTNLGRSCMSYTTCQSFFKLYTENPEVCRLVIQLDKDGMLISRALLWKLDNGKQFLDRVYSVNDFQDSLLKEWVNKNVPNSLTKPLGILSSLKVKLKEWKFDEYPYLDTLCHLNYNTGVISNVGQDGPNIILSSISGGHSGPGMRWRYSEDKGIYIDNNPPPKKKTWLDKFKDFTDKVFN